MQKLSGPAKERFVRAAKLYFRIMGPKEGIEQQAQAEQRSLRPGEGANGYLSQVLKFVWVEHPDHWPPCTSCGGSGADEADEKCTECKGDGFIVTNRSRRT
jgi:hypothetical protein